MQGPAGEKIALNVERDDSVATLRYVGDQPTRSHAPQSPRFADSDFHTFLKPVISERLALAVATLTRQNESIEYGAVSDQ